MLEFTGLLPPGDVTAAARTAAGRPACPDALAEHLQTGAVPPPPADATTQFRSLHEHDEAAGFPAGAPVRGDDP